MHVRRSVVTVLLALSGVLGTACTIEGAGTKTECETSGCTVTFDRGVDAQASVLGIDLQLVGVEGDLVTLTVGGQELTVPAGDTQPADGAAVTVREVTADQVVVEVSTGLG